MTCMSVTVEENPDHFLDTAFTTHWKSEISTKRKRNCITGALHRAKRISSNFDNELKTLETTFLNAGYHKRFISHTVKSFLEDSSADDNLIPSSFLKSARRFSSSYLIVTEMKDSAKHLSPS